MVETSFSSSFSPPSMCYLLMDHGVAAADDEEEEDLADVSLGTDLDR